MRKGRSPVSEMDRPYLTEFEKRLKYGLSGALLFQGLSQFLMQPQSKLLIMGYFLEGAS